MTLATIALLRLDLNLLALIHSFARPPVVTRTSNVPMERSALKTLLSLSSVQVALMDQVSRQMQTKLSLVWHVILDTIRLRAITPAIHVLLDTFVSATRLQQLHKYHLEIMGSSVRKDSTALLSHQLLNLAH